MGDELFWTIPHTLGVRPFHYDAGPAPFASPRWWLRIACAFAGHRAVIWWRDEPAAWGCACRRCNEPLAVPAYMQRAVDVEVHLG